MLSNAIPGALKHGITVGIGMFLVVIGLEKASLITAGQSSFIELGSLTNPNVLLALFGLVLNLFLYLKKGKWWIFNWDYHHLNRRSIVSYSRCYYHKSVAK